MAGTSPNEPGYIYILLNDTNPNEFKIGLSVEPNRRIKQLHTSGTALPMIPRYLWEVSNMKIAETAAHDIMNYHRVNPRREIFHLVPADSATDLETPHPHLGGHDLADLYLETVCERIEEIWDHIGIDYKLVYEPYFNY